LEKFLGCPSVEVRSKPNLDEKQRFRVRQSARNTRRQKFNKKVVKASPNQGVAALLVVRQIQAEAKTPLEEHADRFFQEQQFGIGCRHFVGTFFISMYFFLISNLF
jgi:hypothetical protein